MSVDLLTIWQSDRLLMALANLALCGGLAWACLCRIAVMSSATTTWQVRGAYCVLLATAVATATLPTWSGEWPGWGSLMLAGAQLVVMWAGRLAWRGATAHPARRIGEINAAKQSRRRRADDSQEES